MATTEVGPGERRVAAHACFPGEQLRGHIVGAGRYRRLAVAVRRDEQSEVSLRLRGLGPHLEWGENSSTTGPALGCCVAGPAAKAAAWVSRSAVVSGPAISPRNSSSVAAKGGAPCARHKSQERPAAKPVPVDRGGDVPDLVMAGQLPPHQAAREVTSGRLVQRGCWAGHACPPVDRGEVFEPDQPGQLGRHGTSASGAEPTDV